MKAHRFAIVMVGALSAALPMLPATSAAAAARNGRIVFARFHADFAAQLFSTQANGSELRQLTHDPAISAGYPDRSPDGRTIVYEGDPASGQGDSEIFTVSIRGGSSHQLTRNRTEDQDPAWSPDGTHIALCHSTSEGLPSRIFVMRRDGSHLRRLTSSRGNGPEAHTSDCEPQWSPNGRWIAFASARAGRSAIYKVPASGGRIRRVTPLFLDAGDPNWSPDGGRIVFESHVSVPHSSLYTIHPNGSGLQRLTGGPRSENDLFASYSPDGRRIAFFSDRSGDPDIWVMDADGRHPHDITPSSRVIDFAPDWGPSRRR